MYITTDTIHINISSEMYYFTISFIYFICIVVYFCMWRAATELSIPHIPLRSTFRRVHLVACPCPLRPLGTNIVVHHSDIFLHLITSVARHCHPVYVWGYSLYTFFISVVTSVFRSYLLLYISGFYYFESSSSCRGWARQTMLQKY